MDRAAHLINLIHFLQVRGYQRRHAAHPLNVVVDLLEPTDGSCRQDKMRAFCGETSGDGRADAAASAGDEGDTAFESTGH